MSLSTESATPDEIGSAARSNQAMTKPEEESRRWWALYVLCVGMLMIVLDATIVNVALPSIQEDLGFSQNDLAWVVNAYLIAFGGLLLLAGRIGDLIGQRRIFLFGLATFTTQARSFCEKPRSSWMDGSATFTIVASSTIMSIPMQRT